MNGSNNNVERIQKRQARGEEYAEKGRKLNKRDRKAARDEKRVFSGEEV